MRLFCLILGLLLITNVPVVLGSDADNPLNDEVYSTVLSGGRLAKSASGTFQFNCSGNFDLTGEFPSPSTTVIHAVYVFFLAQITTAGPTPTPGETDVPVTLLLASTNYGTQIPAHKDQESGQDHHQMQYIWSLPTSSIDPSTVVYSYGFSDCTAFNDTYGGMLLVVYTDDTQTTPVRVTINQGAEYVRGSWLFGVFPESLFNQTLFSGDMTFGVFVGDDNVDLTDQERLLFEGTPVAGPADLFSETDGQYCTWYETNFTYTGASGTKIGYLDPTDDHYGILWGVATLISPAVAPTPTPSPVPPTWTPSPIPPTPTNTPTHTPTASPTSPCLDFGGTILKIMMIGEPAPDMVPGVRTPAGFVKRAILRDPIFWIPLQITPAV